MNSGRGLRYKGADLGVDQPSTPQAMSLSVLEVQPE